MCWLSGACLFVCAGSLCRVCFVSVLYVFVSVSVSCLFACADCLFRVCLSVLTVGVASGAIFLKKASGGCVYARYPRAGVAALPCFGCRHAALLRVPGGRRSGGRRAAAAAAGGGRAAAGRGLAAGQLEAGRRLAAFFKTQVGYHHFFF